MKNSSEDMVNPPLKIVRSPSFVRFTARLSPRGYIRISAPSHASKRDIEAFIKKAVPELMKKVEVPAKKERYIPVIKNNTVIEFPLLDSKVFFRIEVLKKSDYIYREMESENRFLLKIPETDQKLMKKYAVSLIKDYYYLKAKEYFLDKSLYYAKQLDVMFNRLTIREQVSRWGSCSSKNNLNFNFRLLFAPEKIASYIAAHEVTHLKHKNHSREFWNELKGIFPDYRESKEWLRQNGKSLWRYLEE